MKPKNLHWPIRQDGFCDKRYKRPQILKKDGSRDMRTKLTFGYIDKLYGKPILYIGLLNSTDIHRFDEK